MPVWLRNLQATVRLNVPLLRLQSELLLRLLGAWRYDVSVTCMDSEGVRNLNRTYRNVDSATDVLAFPYHEVCRGRGFSEAFIESIKQGTLPQAERECDYNIGDIVLGVSVIEKEREGVSLEHQLPVIVAHGLCHLLGYSHHTMENSHMMYVREARLLTAYNTTFGTTLHPLTLYAH